MDKRAFRYIQFINDFSEVFRKCLKVLPLTEKRSIIRIIIKKIFTGAIIYWTGLELG